MSKMEITTTVTYRWVKSQSKDNLYMLIQMLMKQSGLQEDALRRCHHLAAHELKRNANCGTVHIARNILRYCNAAGVFEGLPLPEEDANG